MVSVLIFKFFPQKHVNGVFHFLNIAKPQNTSYSNRVQNQKKKKINQKQFLILLLATEPIKEPLQILTLLVPL